MDRRRALGAHVVSLTVFGALLAPPSRARAMDAATPPSCWKATDAAARNACAEAEYAEADRLLNMAYRVATDGSELARRTALRDAERAWLAYRDAHLGAAFSRPPSH